MERISPPQAIHVHTACAVQDTAATEEKQTLEKRMVQQLEETRTKRKAGQTQPTLRHENPSQPEGYENQAHVLHGGIGKKPFDIVLAKHGQTRQKERKKPEAHEKMGRKIASQGCIRETFETQDGIESNLRRCSRARESCSSVP